MLSAESAILLNFHTLRMILFILCRIVITLLAFCACQSDLCTHNIHLRFTKPIRRKTRHNFCKKPLFQSKKKGPSPLSPSQHSTGTGECQLKFLSRPIRLNSEQCYIPSCPMPPAEQSFPGVRHVFRLQGTETVKPCPCRVQQHRKFIFVFPADTYTLRRIFQRSAASRQRAYSR